MKVFYKKNNKEVVLTTSNNCDISSVFATISSVYGGELDDFSSIETDLTNFILVDKDGVVVAVENMDDEFLNLLEPTTEEQQRADFEIRTINLLIEMGLL